MKSKKRARVPFIGLSIVFVLWGGQSFSASPAVLSGVVSSSEEGTMEGVLVSAKKEGGRITVSAVSDSQGRYAFPGDRLSPGDYKITARAVGYDLEDPGVVKVEAGKTTPLHLKLQKTKNLAAQLTNAEWFLSNPEIKKRLLEDYKYGNNCISCHPLAPVVMSRYKAADWPAILTTRMWQYAEAAIYRPSDGLRIPAKLARTNPPRPGLENLAEFLSSINLSSSPDGKHKFALKTLPRVKGRSTKVIVTEYDLPRRECQPHDAAVDPDGMVWYTDVGNPYLGRLNPRTGEIKEWKTPLRNDGHPQLEHTFDIKFDREGNPIVGGYVGIFKFDKRTEQFTTWDVPGGMVAVSPDGTIWSKDQEKFLVNRLDPKTGKSRTYPMPPNSRFYGIEADSKGNLYGASLQLATIGELNGETGKWNMYPTPTPDSGSRRGDMDRQDRFWFAEYYSGKIGMFDTKTKQFKEWDIPPVPWSGPYDVVVDRNGEVWAAGEYTDNVFRLNPVTGQVTAYPVSSGLFMQIQRVDVDNSATPVTVWLGESHLAKIARVDPMD